MFSIHLQSLLSRFTYHEVSVYQHTKLFSIQFLEIARPAQFEQNLIAE